MYTILFYVYLLHSLPSLALLFNMQYCLTFIKRQLHSDHNLLVEFSVADALQFH